MYGFSYNGLGKVDTTATIYPAVAWWDGTYALPDSDRMFRRWASHEFSTDWGTRDMGEHEALYDPISYHQGTVWPLFTGWAAMAEYRAGRPLAGYQHLMENANLTWAQDLSAVTELLSGQYFDPVGQSTTHQLWSSAMVLTPSLRGLFGVSFDAPTNTLHVAPQLPADWSGATLRHVPAGSGRVTLRFTRAGAAMEVRMEMESGPAPRLAGTSGNALRVSLPGAELALPATLPLPGSATTELKLLEQHSDAHSATWVIEALGGSEYVLPLRVNGVKTARAEGADFENTAPVSNNTPLAGNALLPSGNSQPDPALKALHIRFPPGAGYTEKTVTVRW